MLLAGAQEPGGAGHARHAVTQLLNQLSRDEFITNLSSQPRHPVCESTAQQLVLANCKLVASISWTLLRGEGLQKRLKFGLSTSTPSLLPVL
ncbi:hypothetical protein WJX84_006778 [Apatococcus fuscideae]|uniref:Uncharacterized protein n=1 Tax=Apatococcus fuscideae TaxID=2026836 RepID=A0AAW1TC01_9CHLO